MSDLTSTKVSGKTILAPHAAELVQRVQSGKSAFEVVYRSHESWPLLPSLDGVATSSATRRGHGPGAPLRISVLDSSFNPPTLAHLALLQSLPSTAARARPPDEDDGCTDPLWQSEDYDARLLLLSVRNADKSLKPTDATYAQRLEMMVRLALEPGPASASASALRVHNVAVAIINEPTFIRKSKVIRAFLLEHLASSSSEKSEDDPTSSTHLPDIQLSFLMGFDTLERFLAPRYYAPPDAALSDDNETSMFTVLDEFFASAPAGDGSRVVCAHRSSSSVSAKTSLEDTKVREQTMMFAQRYSAGDSTGISFISLPDGKDTLSSSEVRNAVSKGLSGWKETVTDQIACFIKAYALYSG